MECLVMEADVLKKLLLVSIIAFSATFQSFCMEGSGSEPSSHPFSWYANKVKSSYTDQIKDFLSRHTEDFNNVAVLIFLLHKIGNMPYSEIVKLTFAEKKTKVQEALDTTYDTDSNSHPFSWYVSKIKSELDKIKQHLSQSKKDLNNVAVLVLLLRKLGFSYQNIVKLSLETKQKKIIEILRLPRVLSLNGKPITTSAALDPYFHRPEALNTSTLPSPMTEAIFNHLLYLVKNPEVDAFTDPKIKDLTKPELLKVLQLASHLNIKDWHLLQGIITKFKSLETTNELLSTIVDNSIANMLINVPFQSYVVGQKIDKSLGIQWSPDGKYFFVKFEDESGVVYSYDGIDSKPTEEIWLDRTTSIELDNVSTFEWSPDSKHYFVIDKTNPTKDGIYNTSYHKNDPGYSHTVPASFVHVDTTDSSYDIEQKDFKLWSPAGNYLFIPKKHSASPVYNMHGEVVTEFPKAHKFKCNKSDEFCVSVVSGDAQLYEIPYDHSSISTIEAKIENVKDIQWSPAGDSYFLAFQDKTGQFFNTNGSPISSSLDNASHAYWSPTGKYCFVASKLDSLDKSKPHAKGQLYDNGGNKIGDELKNILSVSWDPKEKYFSTVNQDSSNPEPKNNTGAVYNTEGEEKLRISYPYTGVNKTYWNQTGSTVAVGYSEYDHGYTRNKTVLYQKDSDESGDDLDIYDIRWSPSGEMFLAKHDHYSSAKLYTKDGKEVHSYRNVRDFEWNPDGNSYYITFTDKSAKIYPSELPLFYQVIVDYINQEYNKQDPHRTRRGISLHEMNRAAYNALPEAIVDSLYEERKLTRVTGTGWS